MNLIELTFVKASNKTRNYLSIKKSSMEIGNKAGKKKLTSF